MLHFHLSPIFKARGIGNPYRFLIQAGFSSQTAYKIVNRDVHNIHFRHLERLCTVLNCTPNDLFYWEENSHQHLSEEHVLRGLKKRETAVDWNQKLRSMPLDQLDQFMEGVRDELMS